MDANKIKFNITKLRSALIYADKAVREFGELLIAPGGFVDTLRMIELSNLHTHNHRAAQEAAKNGR